MSGLWGCFDEFNRIELEVLSVVATQVESIMQAKKQNLKTFMFPGHLDFLVGSGVRVLTGSVCGSNFS